MRSAEMAAAKRRKDCAAKEGEPALRALWASSQLAFTTAPGDCANRCSLFELQPWHAGRSAIRVRKILASAEITRSRAFHIAQRMPVWRIA